MNDAVELNLGKYFNALRRWAWLVVLLAMVGGVLGAVIGRAPVHTATLQLGPTHRTLPLNEVPESIEFDTEALLRVVRSQLQTSATTADIRAASAPEVDLAISYDADDLLLRVAISGPSASAVTEASEAVAATAGELYASQFTTALDAVETALQAKKSGADERVAILLGLLTDATPDQTTLAQALTAELQDRSSDSIAAESDLRLLNGLVTEAPRELLLLANDAPPPSDRTVLLAVAGLIAFAALSIGIVILLALLDQTVRTRRDLARIGIDGLLGALPVKPSSRSLSAIGAAVTSVAGAASTQLVPLSQHGAVAATSIAAELDDPASAVVTTPLDESPEAVRRAAQAGVTVLFVRWGKVSRTTLVSRSNELIAAGTVRLAVVLYDVPTRELTALEA